MLELLGVRDHRHLVDLVLVGVTEIQIRPPRSGFVDQVVRFQSAANHGVGSIHATIVKEVPPDSLHRCRFTGGPDPDPRLHGR